MLFAGIEPDLDVMGSYTTVRSYKLSGDYEKTSFF